MAQGFLSPTVYVAIPVFNRVALTLRCIQQVLAQTYPNIQVIVSDGGSSDGSPDIIAREFPQVTVLTSRRELWWSGAMARAIDHVLEVSTCPDDLVLMMNNDTEFDGNYVSTLVRVARETGGAVGALTVDSRDPSIILDAGEFIEWESYAFPVKTRVAPDEKYFEGVDVLPGRGSIIPLAMIRAVGNIDAKRFPHYIADYEFFARVKRHGFRLGVSYEAVLRSDPTVTGLAAKRGDRASLMQALKLSLSRRSMDNVLDHYRFIGAAAPEALKSRTKRRFLYSLAIRVMDRIGVRPLVLGLAWLVLPPRSVSAEDAAKAGFDVIEATEADLLVPFMVDGRVRYFAPRHVMWGSRQKQFVALRDAEKSGNQRVPRAVIWARRPLLFPRQYVTEEQCRDLGLDPEGLVADGVLRRDEVRGFYVLPRLGIRISHQVHRMLGSQACQRRDFTRRARRLRMAQVSIKEAN